MKLGSDTLKSTSRPNCYPDKFIRKDMLPEMEIEATQTLKTKSFFKDAILGIYCICTDYTDHLLPNAPKAVGFRELETVKGVCTKLFKPVL